MKRTIKTLLAIVALFSVAGVHSQAVAVSTMIEKENRNAVMIEINQPQKIAADALHEKLQRAGLDERIKNGAVKYKGVVLSEISAEKIDIYTKVEKAANNTSVVYMAVSRGYNNFTNPADDSLVTANVILFLNSFVKDADNHSTDIGITTMLDETSKSEKIYQDLLDEQSGLEKKKSKIDARLAEIQNELSVRKADLDKRKPATEELKTKRFNSSN